MNKLKVISVSDNGIEFEGGIRLFSEHFAACCELHELTFTDLTMSDFDGLEFDLSGDSFFRGITDFGIELIPLTGHPIRIPGHGYNNGFYGTHIDLCIEGPGISKRYDVTDCQTIFE